MKENVLLYHIDGYEQTEEIRKAVRAILTMEPNIAALLDCATKKTLVVVKPNWVQPDNIRQGGGWLELITHPAVIEAVVEELAFLMHGIGRITVCDSPHTHADMAELQRLGNFTERMEGIRQRFPEIQLSVLDLRKEVWIQKEDVTISRLPLDGDPCGYAALNLGRDSLFFGHDGEGHYYGADYDSEIVNSHHRGETQEYLISKTPLECDLFVNIPKLKTHKKTGITCSLKNLVGINGDKNWLPHHTEGTPETKGDEYPGITVARKIEFKAKKLLRKLALKIPGFGTWLMRKSRAVGKNVFGDNDKVIRSGNWHGNDTTWRMVLDLNRTLLYGNMDGTWNIGKKRYLSIVDGIVGGEGEGPLAPSPVDSRILFGGTCPAIVDAVAATLMGFSLPDLRLIVNAFEEHRWSIGEIKFGKIRVRDMREEKTYGLDDLPAAVEGGFRPHFGWKTINPSYHEEK